MKAIEQHHPTIGTLPLCKAFNIPKASFYRHRKQADNPVEPMLRQRPKHALTTVERQIVSSTLNSPLYVDLAPSQVYTQLLEEGTYLCSTRTMYRVLAANDQVRERRNVARHPVYTKPELLATGPNEV